MDALGVLLILLGFCGGCGRYKRNSWWPLIFAITFFTGIGMVLVSI